MAAREVQMIVVRYFSTIRHQIPPSARIGRLAEFERPSWLAHWGINSDHPLKSLAKSIAFVSRKKDTTRKKKSNRRGPGRITASCRSRSSKR